MVAAAKELLDGVVLQGNGGDNLHLLVSAATQQLSNTQDGGGDEDTPRVRRLAPLPCPSHLCEERRKRVMEVLHPVRHLAYL